MINNVKKGFTLIETLVAVLILVTAIAGPLTIASKGLTTALVARDQVTAYYLAQDAVEFVRYARDTNRLQGGNWLTGAGGGANVIDLTPCTGADGCAIDSIAAPFVTACGATCSGIKFDTFSNFFNTSGTVLPAFVRTVTITPQGVGDSEATLTVVVTWADIAGVTHPGVTVTEEFLNWQ